MVIRQIVEGTGQPTEVRALEERRVEPCARQEGPDQMLLDAEGLPVEGLGLGHVVASEPDVAQVRVGDAEPRVGKMVTASDGSGQRALPGESRAMKRAVEMMALHSTSAAISRSSPSP